MLDPFCFSRFSQHVSTFCKFIFFVFSLVQTSSRVCYLLPYSADKRICPFGSETSYLVLTAFLRCKVLFNVVISLIIWLLKAILISIALIVSKRDWEIEISFLIWSSNSLLLIDAMRNSESCRRNFRWINKYTLLDHSLNGAFQGQ